MDKENMETINKPKGQPMVWEKIFAKTYISDKIYKEFIKLSAHHKYLP